MFEPGTKVVCIDDKFDSFLIKEFNLTQLPKLNETYTVRDIVPGIDPKSGNETVSVYLEELKNETNEISKKTGLPVMERGFSCHRFRELEEEKEEIKIKVKKEEPILV